MADLPNDTINRNWQVTQFNPDGSKKLVDIHNAAYDPALDQFNPAYAGAVLPNPNLAPGFAALPSYASGPEGVAQLFDPNFGRTETLTHGAENAVAGGFAGSGFAGNQSLRLLDSERKANLLAGHQILEPYLQREHDTSENAANRASRLNEIAAQGANALQQLQLSEAGDTARLNASQRAELERQVLAGQQSMQQLTLREGGETARQRTGIGGQLADTLLKAALAGRSSGSPATTTGRTPGGGVYTHYDQGQRLGDYSDVPAPVSGGSGITSRLGGSSIDAILRRYGLTV
jgi:hypothetical protein